MLHEWLQQKPGQYCEDFELYDTGGYHGRRLLGGLGLVLVYKRDDVFSTLHTAALKLSSNTKETLSLLHDRYSNINASDYVMENKCKECVTFGSQPTPAVCDECLNHRVRSNLSCIRRTLYRFYRL
jgi:hypothetical protein